MSEELLSARKLAKFFGAKLVFKGVTLTVRGGEILLIAGPNGAGKSTLMKMLAGLSRPSAGEVHMRVEPESMAYLGHATFLYPGLTALENVGFWAKMYGLSSNRSDLLPVLERVGLATVAEEKAGGFSRGMAQRLNLARVFLVRPKLLFLDEPGTGLDVASMSLLRREIAGFRDGGSAVVWISHHVAEDARIANTVLALGRGKTAYYGPAEAYQPEAVC